MRGWSAAGAPKALVWGMGLRSKKERWERRSIGTVRSGSAKNRLPGQGCLSADLAGFDPGRRSILGPTPAAGPEPEQRRAAEQRQHTHHHVEAPVTSLARDPGIGTVEADDEGRDQEHR